MVKSGKEQPEEYPIPVSLGMEDDVPEVSPAGVSRAEARQNRRRRLGTEVQDDVEQELRSRFTESPPPVPENPAGETASGGGRPPWDDGDEGGEAETGFLPGEEPEDASSEPLAAEGTGDSEEVSLDEAFDDNPWDHEEGSLVGGFVDGDETGSPEKPTSGTSQRAPLVIDPVDPETRRKLLDAPALAMFLSQLCLGVGIRPISSVETPSPDAPSVLGKFLKGNGAAPFPEHGQVPEAQRVPQPVVVKEGLKRKMMDDLVLPPKGPSAVLRASEQASDRVAGDHLYPSTAVPLAERGALTPEPGAEGPSHLRALSPERAASGQEVAPKDEEDEDDADLRRRVIPSLKGLSMLPDVAPGTHSPSAITPNQPLGSIFPKPSPSDRSLGGDGAVAPEGPSNGRAAQEASRPSPVVVPVPKEAPGPSQSFWAGRPWVFLGAAVVSGLLGGTLVLYLAGFHPFTRLPAGDPLDAARARVEDKKRVLDYLSDERAGLEVSMVQVEEDIRLEAQAKHWDRVETLTVRKRRLVAGVQAIDARKTAILEAK